MQQQQQQQQINPIALSNNILKEITVELSV